MNYPVFESVPAMLAELRPDQPVYCVDPLEYQNVARRFIEGFPGRVLYAVKVNDEPGILKLLFEAGIRHFDCASVPEIELVNRVCPGSTCYFMIPVWLRGAARRVFDEFGVRHFVVDHEDGLQVLGSEVQMDRCVVFVRMAVSHHSALNNLSLKFGAAPENMQRLLCAVAATGAEPAMAFNVGSAVTDPEAYQMAIERARTVLDELPFKIRLLDIGGGFAISYPGFEVPPIRAYWDAIRKSIASLPLAVNGEVITEPGRALAASGLSAVVEVLQRKDQTLYINDGVYGIFWELRFKGHEGYPVAAYRNARELVGPGQAYRIFGPTCDAFDVLPGKVELPADIRAGDYLEFSRIGAYSLAGRTNFNGHYSNKIVTIKSRGNVA